MIIYNTTFHIENEILDECLDYLKTSYIPTAAASGFLRTPVLRRIMTDDPGEGSSFSVQFQVKNVDTLQHWLDTQGAVLHQELVNRFGYKVAGFTTILEEIDLG